MAGISAKCLKAHLIPEDLEEGNMAGRSAKGLHDEIELEDLLCLDESVFDLLYLPGEEYSEEEDPEEGNMAGRSAKALKAHLIPEEGNMAGTRFKVLLYYFDSKEQELENFFRSLKRNDDFLDRWKTMLRALTFMVLDFERKNNPSQSPVEWNRNSVVVDLWLYEVEEAFYQAEDVMDEIFTEALQHRLAAESQTKSSPVWIYAKEKERKMEEILYRIDCFLKVGDALDWIGGEEYDVYRMKLQKIRFNPIWGYEYPGNFIYFVDESEVFGMDVKKEEFMNILLSHGTYDKELSVIPIQGQSGIGKTTLARIITTIPS